MGRRRWEGPSVAMPRWCCRFVEMVPPCAVLQLQSVANEPPTPSSPAGGAQSLCVLGCEIGGRWNASAMSLLRRLVALRSCRAPPAVRGPAQAAWARPWWSVLSTAVQQATGHRPSTCCARVSAESGASLGRGSGTCTCRLCQPAPAALTD